ncbi:MAG TPA: metallophosphoesterase family protein [Anaerolineae bacterium]|nr:metallophosphoesterase family protein [Anaerolineae bacterium]
MRTGRLTHIFLLLLGMLIIGALVVLGAVFYSSITSETPIPIPTIEIVITPEKKATVQLPPKWTPTPSPVPTETSTVWSETESANLDSADALAKKRALGELLGPYLQNVTSDSVTIAWRTAGASQGEVVYGSTSEYNLSALDAVLGKQHHVTLSRLQPDTLYHYRLISGDVPLTEDMRFRTAPGPERTTLSFVVYGDTQHNPEIHRSIINRAQSLEPDFALHVGDLVNIGWNEAQWDEFFRIEKEFLAHVPLFPTLGNHETESKYYFERFFLPGNERWYSVSYGPVRIICLQIDGIAKFDEVSEQYQWLEQILKKNTQPWLFVFFHKPPYSAEYEGPEEGHIRSRLTPLFEQHGVKLVFSGHNHNYQRSYVNGITYIVTGGGGGNLSDRVKEDDYLIRYYVGYHLVQIIIEGDELNAIALTPEGAIIDRFEISLP